MAKEPSRDDQPTAGTSEQFFGIGTQVLCMKYQQLARSPPPKAALSVF